MIDFDSTAWPIHAFHYTTKSAAEEVIRHVKAPDALVGMSFLAAMSVACQGLIDVRLPTGQVRPVCLNLLTIAESGERKTTVDNIVAAPIYAHDEENAKSYEAAAARYEVEYCYWKAIEAGLRIKATKAAQNGGMVE